MKNIKVKIQQDLKSNLTFVPKWKINIHFVINNTYMGMTSDTLTSDWLMATIVDLNTIMQKNTAQTPFKTTDKDCTEREIFLFFI